MTPDVVDLYRAWTVSASAATVQALVSQQLSAAGYTEGETSGSAKYGVLQGMGSGWMAPGAPSAQLQVSIQIDGTNTSHAVVIYVPARPPGAFLASGPASVQITATGWPGQAAAKVQVTATDPATIAGLVATFNALPVGFQGVRSCPMDPGGGQWRLTMDFRYAAGTSVTTEVPSCGSYAVSIGISGNGMALSDSGRQLLNLVGRAFGLPSVTPGQSPWGIPTAARVQGAPR